MKKKFKRAVEKEEDSLLKRTFKGETLEGYLEAKKCERKRVGNLNEVSCLWDAF